MSSQEAMAIERGARTKREAMFSDRSAVFAIHYFNADGTEVGYYLPSLADWNNGEIHLFDPPREWSEQILSTLGLPEPIEGVDYGQAPKPEPRA